MSRWTDDVREIVQIIQDTLLKPFKWLGRHKFMGCLLFLILSPFLIPYLIGKLWWNHPFYSFFMTIITFCVLGVLTVTLVFLAYPNKDVQEALLDIRDETYDFFGIEPSIESSESASTTKSQLDTELVSPTTVRLSWETSNTKKEKIAKIIIQRNEKKIDTLDYYTTSYKDKGLKTNSSYNYKVVFVNSTGGIISSLTDSATTPKVEGQLDTELVSPTTVRLSWDFDNVEKEEIAKIVIKRNGRVINTLRSYAGSYDDQGLSSHTNYDYQVSFYDHSDASILEKNSNIQTLRVNFGSLKEVKNQVNRHFGEMFEWEKDIDSRGTTLTTRAENNKCITEIQIIEKNDKDAVSSVKVTGIGHGGDYGCGSYTNESIRNFYNSIISSPSRECSDFWEEDVVGNEKQQMFNVLASHYNENTYYSDSIQNCDKLITFKTRGSSVNLIFEDTKLQ